MEKDNKARCELTVAPHITQRKWDKLETFNKLAKIYKCDTTFKRTTEISSFFRSTSELKPTLK